MVKTKQIEWSMIFFTLILSKPYSAIETQPSKGFSKVYSSFKSQLFEALSQIQPKSRYT